ncbi:unnamed protein product [Pedinophyceae sp. YPF-701]|nr:unnamed protein product [Pedinophyceae sp. YPF-701]
MAGQAVKGPHLAHKVSEQLYVSTPTWWLESRFHFSFAEYHDVRNTNFGALRVVNDDLVKAGGGFPTHPHRDAEIFSYVVDGELSHKDSMGNGEAVRRGCVQYMSAGTGVRHSEYNHGDSTLRFLQVWLMPDKRGHTPKYGSTEFERSERHNRWLQILGGTTAPPDWQQNSPGDKLIRLHQDVNVFVTESDPGAKLRFSLAPARQAYVVAIEGSAELRSGAGEAEEVATMGERDAMQLVRGRDVPSGEVTLAAGPRGVHAMVIEMRQAR